MSHSSEVIKLRHRILTTLSKMTFSGELEDSVKNILNDVIKEEGPRYRCCVYKERAILKDRLKVLFSQRSDISVQEAANKALEGKVEEDHVVKVVPLACDQCPIDKFIVTNACRNCLAHNCMNNCPRNAIMIVQNHAYIDKHKCVECGLCKKSCQYSAIIEVNRPCESACALGAITAGADRKAAINYDKCVQCGSCKVACPFGAIEETSILVQLIQALKNQEKIAVMLAPSFVGQFGPKVKPGQIISALQKIGFTTVTEAAYGADVVSVEDGLEFIEAVPNEKKFVTSSCCPAFVNMIDKYVPDVKNNISTVVSPMVAMGKIMKAAAPDTKILFVGPCTAKKGEAKKYANIIDYVATFEEIACLINGYGIEIEDEENIPFISSASKEGNGFALAGGVAKAVEAFVKENAPDKEFSAAHVDGLENCRNTLLLLSKGKIPANFIEGMACTGGCVGGPGVLNDGRVTGKLVERQAKEIKLEHSSDNENARKTVLIENIDCHVK